MFELKTTSKPVRRALLIGVYSGQESQEHANSLLDELGELVDTLGITVVEKKLIKSARLQPRYLLGSGKADEIIELAKTIQADVVIFDNVITPGQQRNWDQQLSRKELLERRSELKVIRGRFGELVDCDIVHLHTIGSRTWRKLLQKGPKKVVSVHVVPDSFVGSI